jgi:hypothetical protein
MHTEGAYQASNERTQLVLVVRSLQLSRVSAFCAGQKFTTKPPAALSRHDLCLACLSQVDIALCDRQMNLL